MARLEVGQKAPEFKVSDYKKEEIRLSDFEGKKNVFIVLNRGFV